MNYNETTNTGTGMNIESYEDMAVDRSKTAKKVAIGAAAVAGAAVVGAGTAYAMTDNGEDVLDETLTPDAVLAGAEETAQEYAPQAQQPAEEVEQVRVVYREAPKEAASEEESAVKWEETENYYVNGEKVASIERGTVDGHKFMLADVDGDNYADAVAIDMNDNGIYEDNEVQRLSTFDGVKMGHQTAHTSDSNYYVPTSDPTPEPQLDPYHSDPYMYQEPVHNNFEDEKTGEDYEYDFAENNADYNPNADVDYSANDNYLAESDGYDSDDYHAGVDLAEENEEPNVDGCDMADADAEGDSYDSMMENEEFLG